MALLMHLVIVPLLLLDPALGFDQVLNQVLVVGLSGERLVPELLLQVGDHVIHGDLFQRKRRGENNILNFIL